ncbi:MAG: UDP-N-acetylpyruvoylglucosamine reductase [Candidatus Saccharibacteria bacterium]|nr:UDP-N-acetylpyruvoylglucosamine reductase [Candidatus Saccharibacteria bacterium]
MNILENVDLRAHSTMRLGGTTRYYCEATDRMEVLEALSWAQQRNLPVQMIGSGSNIVWKDEGFSGLLIVNKILRYELFKEDETNVYLTVGAGEPWDSVVERSVQAGLTGIEALSLVPGTAGATPIQNVGAYGQDVSQTLTTIEAYDTAARDFITLPAYDCGFGYRTSRFKATDRGRFFITAVTFHLTIGNPEGPYYPAVGNYLREHNITEVTPATLRQAVIAIRSAKLPDPAVVANCGSFFANPIISSGQFNQLSADLDTEIPHWKHDADIKVSAAWLIEQTGFKDYHDSETGVATWPTQPLVLVNEAAANTTALLAFKQKIITAVQAKFGITLQQEPELLPL